MKVLLPQSWLLLATLLYALIAGAATFSTLNTPWMGIEFAKEQRTGGIKIRSVQENGPAANLLTPGGQVFWISAVGLPPILFESFDLLEAPYQTVDYANYRAFLQRQNQIFARLQQSEVVFGLADNQQAIVKPASSRPLSSLPPGFWFLQLCALAAFMVTVAVRLFGRKNNATAYFTLSGVGLLITLLTLLPSISRELALDDSRIRLLSITNHFGNILFVGGLLGIFWNYPARIGRFRGDLVVMVMLLLVWLIDTAQLFGTINLGYRYPMLGIGLSGLVMLVWQWRQSAKDPTARAIVYWIVLAAVAGPSILIAIQLVPLFLGLPSIISLSTAWGILTLFFVMMAIGVARYRLFKLEHAWFGFWGWFLGGILIVLVDLLLVYLFSFGNQIALVISLAIVGFVYFPVRQYVWGLSPWHQRQQNLLELLPKLLSLSLEPRIGPSESDWQLALYKVFEPLEIREISTPVDKVAIEQDNLALRIPGILGCPALELYGAQRGGRLFNARDIEFATALGLLFERAKASRKAMHRGAYLERSRIARDLHDDVGAALLSMVYRSKAPDVRNMARDALAKLRNVIHSLEVDARVFSELLADWRLEVKERCEIAGIKLSWPMGELSRDPLLDSRQQINMHRLIQEAITNIIKHSGASRVEVKFIIDEQTLYVSIIDDGAGLPEDCPEGSGMSNMRRRVTELGGDIQWQTLVTGGCRVTWNATMPNTEQES